MDFMVNLSSPQPRTQAAGYVLSRVDLTVAVFLLLVYVRSWMQPDQVRTCTSMIGCSRSRWECVRALLNAARAGGLAASVGGSAHRVTMLHW